MTALRPENWRYSAYPLVLATVSRVLGLHPMDAYPWTSVLGALVLVSASGAFAWIATGRFSTALLATWISGTWGGLGFWAWLFERGPSLVTSGTLRLLDTDYHEPRFFGEFTGPYSELTSYLASAPFYPREAALLPFWLGLALLYRGLQPERRAPSLIAVCALFLVSTALYPYYGLTAPIALGIVAIALGSGDETMRQRRRWTVRAGALVLAGAVILGDLASRAYRGVSAWEWLTRFIVAAPVAVEVNKAMPSMDFVGARILSGQFFLGVAAVGALVFGLRPKDSLSVPQRRAVLVTLMVCVAHGLLNHSSDYLNMLLLNFRWFVSWRALLSPVAAVIAALFIEHLVAQARTRSLATLAALTLVPTLSTLLWSYSVTDYLSRTREQSDGRGLMASLWSEYREHGRSWLGRVVIPEPLAIEGATLGERNTASAAFGIAVHEADRLFKNKAALLPSNLGAPHEMRAVALRKGSAAAVRLEASGCCERFLSYGRYDIYVPRAAPVTAPAPPPR